MDPHVYIPSFLYHLFEANSSFSNLNGLKYSEVLGVRVFPNESIDLQVPVMNIKFDTISYEVLKRKKQSFIDAISRCGFQNIHVLFKEYGCFIFMTSVNGGCPPMGSFNSMSNLIDEILDLSLIKDVHEFSGQ